MKTFDIANLTKLVTLFGSGSSTLISIIAMELYVNLPSDERNSFLLLLIVLSLLSSLGQLVTWISSRKEVEKAINKPPEIIIQKEVEHKIIRVHTQEENDYAMTDTWEYQYQ
jgi:hypothetical protein